MPKLTPQEATEKHARRLKGSTQDIQAGIARVTVAPGEQAAKKQEKMRANINAAIDSGKWAQRTRSVSLDSWKRAATEKGVGRIAAGIDGAKQKVTDFFTQLLPFQELGQQKIANMPDLTFEDSLNRMTEWARHMKGFKRQ